MKPNRCITRSAVTFALLLTFNIVSISFSKILEQDNPVLVQYTAVAPVIDGKGDDACWENTKWQTIDEGWSRQVVDSADYSGRYKIVWSSTNLLYILIEVTDDAFVDGFVPGTSPEIFHFDIAGVFIDEDTSGGLHLFDATGNNASIFGSNAENAFAYEIYANFPIDSEQITTEHYVEDLDGTSWSDAVGSNYTSHLPDFALRKTGNRAVWEFSLIVYNDTYEENNKEPARVQFVSGKMMGLLIMYCDNDDPDGERDNWFGSVRDLCGSPVITADCFGRVKLVSEDPSGVCEENAEGGDSDSNLYPNPATFHSMLRLDNSYRGEISIRMFNILGQQVFQATGLKGDKSFTQKLSFNRLPPGSYFVRIQMGNSIVREKLIIIDKN